MSERFIVTKSEANVISGTGTFDKSYGSTQEFSTDNLERTESSPCVGDDDQHIGESLSSYERNLYLYHEEVPERPQVATMLSALANYNVAFPNIMESLIDDPKKANLGTTSGVYLPCIQNILGVIFFLRMGWLIGTAGVVDAFFIVFMCCCVTFTTCISLSAIATNGIVHGGGSYFMVSRSLGPAIGGAVGILFYLATSTATSMYVIGAVEIFLNYMAPNLSLFGDFREDNSIMYNNFRAYGTILLILIGIIVFIGVRFVSKFAPLALFSVVISLLCVYTGVFVNYHGRQDIKICVLGDRLLKKDNYTCSADPNDTTSLFYVFCYQAITNGTDLNTTSYVCDPYFKSHNVIERLAIPGIASHIFQTNIKSRYRHQGDFLSDSDNREEDNAYGHKTHNEVLIDLTTSFTVLLAIFFPSCTGILAGSNRSGDLADAQKSVPTGTIAAQLTATFIYISGVLLFAASFDNLFMRDKFGESIGGSLAVAQLAWPNPWIVIIGSFLSTVGAGLQTLTGAPRLLQAIAKDEIIPFLKVFSYTSSRNEPTMALFFTLLICEAGILIGNLDKITPIITMFFLMCYMFVNVTCVMQSLLRTPNWRPRFKYYHWTLSLAGALLCLILMFLSNWYYALGAIGLAICIYEYIEFRGAENEWGGGLKAFELSTARFSLLKAENFPQHARNWRPQVLVLAKLNKDLEPKCPHLFSFASQLKAGKGLTLACSILEGQYKELYSEAQASKQCLKRVMAEENLKGFCDVLVTKDVLEGMCTLIQTSGLGALKPNAVILGWPHGWRQSPDDKSWKVFLDVLECISTSKHAALVPKGIQLFPRNDEKVCGNIDVWWILVDGGMLLVLPFLLKQHKVWKNCKIRVFTVAQAEDNTFHMEKDIKKFLYNVRIDAEVKVIEMVSTDISPYTYERTLHMEQRNAILKQLKLETSKKGFTDVQNIVDHHRNPRVKFADEDKTSNAHQVPVRPHSIDGSVRTSEHVQLIPSTSMGIPSEFSSENATATKVSSNLTGDSSKKSNIEGLKINADVDVLRMHTAVKLNEVIVAHSHMAQLVIINFPGFPKNYDGSKYMEFLEVLTEGLDRVLLIKGAGREVLTMF